MEENLPEIVFASSDSLESKAIGRQVRAGKLRKLAPRVYTSDLSDRPEAILRRNLYPILSHLYPGALLSHRTALEGGPTEDGTIFLTFKYNRRILLPGLTVRLLAGPEPLESDTPFMGSLFMSSRARAYLENLQVSRSRNGPSKTLPRGSLEERLDRMFRLQGEEELTRLRDQARAIAGPLGMEVELAKLERVLEALLGTGKGTRLLTPVARARSAGLPYDPARLDLLQTLFSHLRSRELPLRQETTTEMAERKHLAFFEAYFSNFIEGTEFELEIAREIVFLERIPSRRPADAHDILGTFRIVSSASESSREAVDAEGFLRLLQARHGVVMAGRPEIAPGRFKVAPNRAGGTHFVLPELVRGTLTKGFEIARSLTHPFKRGIFLLFLVAEVHPFSDGNGRLSRLVLNAELARSGLVRVIVPTVFRDDLLLALRALSRGGKADPLVRALDHAQLFTAQLDFSTYERARAVLEACHAFKEPDEGRLRLPAELT